MNHAKPALFLAVVLALPMLSPALIPARKAHAVTARTLVIPTTKRGDVSAIYLKRIDRGIQRTLSFSGRLKVTKDTDRPSQKGKANAIGARQVTPLEKQIEQADKLRSEGMEQQTKDSVKAYALFVKAIKLYEGAAAELVDFTKLADAYTRAGLIGFKNRIGANNVKAWFMKGLALQPTLVISRRGQPAKLLKLFDATVKHMQGLKKAGVEVIGGCPNQGCPAAVCYIDGIKSGALPAKNDNLIRGQHFVQLRGPGIKPWGKIIFVARPNFTVKAKPVMIKVKTAKNVAPLTFDDVAMCAAHGAFSKKTCDTQVQGLLRQTDSDFVLFTMVKADRYGRLTLHGFLGRPPAKRRKPAQIVALKAVSIQKSLSDLNAQLTTFAAIVDKAAAAFPAARALSTVPRAYSE